MELCTPCAGLRPGAADPTRSKAAYPPPRLVLREKILIFSTIREQNDSYWSADQKCEVLMVVFRKN